MLLYELLQSELVTQKHFSVFGGRGGVQEGVMVLRGERESRVARKWVGKRQKRMREQRSAVCWEQGGKVERGGKKRKRGKPQPSLSRFFSRSGRGVRPRRSAAAVLERVRGARGPVGE